MLDRFSIPPAITVAIGVFALGKLLDFGVRRWSAQIWTVARGTLWDSVNGLSAPELHSMMIRGLVRHLFAEEDSPEQKRVIVVTYAYVCLALAATVALASLYIFCIDRELASFAGHPKDRYPLMLVRDVSAVVLGLLVGMACLLAVLTYGSNAIAAAVKPLDWIIRLVRDRSPRWGDRLNTVVCDLIKGTIWGISLGIPAIAVVLLGFAMIDSDWRAACLALFLNVVYDSMTFGATALLLRAASKGGTARQLLCIVADIAAAVALAFVSYFAMNLAFGIHGFRWATDGPMNSLVAVLMCSSLIPTVLVLLFIVALIALRFGQIVTRLVGLHAIETAARPDKTDDAQPFSAIAFLVVIPLLVYQGIAWLF